MTPMPTVETAATKIRAILGSSRHVRADWTCVGIAGGSPFGWEIAAARRVQTDSRGRMRTESRCSPVIAMTFPGGRLDIGDPRTLLALAVLRSAAPPARFRGALSARPAKRR